MGKCDEHRETFARRQTPLLACGFSTSPSTQIKRFVLVVLICFFPLVSCQMSWAGPCFHGRAVFLMQQGGGYYYGPGRYGPGHAMHPPPPRQEHLPQWFRQHQYLSLQDQERALHSEPGFNRLPPGEQQKLINRLRLLNMMPPSERQRTLDRMEAFERLSPTQRQQVRSTVQQVTRMPEYRRRMMHKAFHDLSRMPPEQRQTVMNSPEFKGQFSPQEREWLGTLLSVQPYDPEPAPTPNPAPAPGGR